MKTVHVYVFLGALAAHSKQLNSQQSLHFPSDNQQSFAQVFLNNVSDESRRSQLYEKSVEKVISDGLSSLTLAINKISPTMSKELANSDTRVYGPVSIAGK